MVFKKSNCLGAPLVKALVWRTALRIKKRISNVEQGILNVEGDGKTFIKQAIGLFSSNRDAAFWD
jgi:hypothetical protein